ncbi:MAG: hypothetical protein IJM68_01125 [Synergistaceae bacterium]|nr:hypothetical protein [Synergistaceae bacterium]
MANMKALDAMLDEQMATEEIFQALGILQDYASELLTAVQNRLEKLETDSEADGLTEEQQKLLELQESLENIGVM